MWWLASFPLALALAATCSGESSEQGAGGPDASAGGAGGAGGVTSSGATGGAASLDAASDGPDTSESGADSSDGSDGSIDPSQLCAKLYKDVCKYFALQYPSFIAIYYGSEAECVALLVPWCDNGLSLPGSSITKVMSCLEATEKALAGTPDAGFNADCVELGTLEAGQPCVSLFQCKTTCTFYASNGCGKCKAKGGSGAPCTFTSDCLYGYECSGGTCLKASYLGQACGASMPCDKPLQCKNGTCEPGGAPGSSCQSLDDCDLLVGPQSCTSGICTLKPLKKLGEACDLVNTWCEGVAQCNNGVCAKPGGQGATCTSNAECASPLLFCISGICQPPNPAFCDN